MSDDDKLKTWATILAVMSGAGAAYLIGKALAEREFRCPECNWKLNANQGRCRNPKCRAEITWE